MRRSFSLVALSLLFVASSSAQTSIKQQPGYFAAIDLLSCTQVSSGSNCSVRGSFGYRLDAKWDVALITDFSYRRGSSDFVYTFSRAIPKQRTKLGFYFNPVVGYTRINASGTGIRAEGGAFLNLTNDTTWVDRGTPWASSYGLNSSVGVFRALKLTPRVSLQPGIGILAELIHTRDVSEDRKYPINFIGAEARNQIIGGPVIRFPLLISVFEDKVIVAELYQWLGLTWMNNGHESFVALGKSSGGLSLRFNF